MKTYANQFAFDIRREVLRNLPFLFFFGVDARRILHIVYQNNG